MKQTRVDSDLFELLSKDHDQASNLFDEIVEGLDTNAQAVKSLYLQLSYALKAHLQAEEDAVYSVFREQRDLRPIEEESAREHHEALRLLRDLDGYDIEDEEFEDTLMELKTAIEQHVAKEEDVVFREMRNAFDEQELEAMAEKFRRAKEQRERELRAA